MLHWATMPSLEDITLDTWITSDQHWGHPKIQEYGGRPDGHFDLMRDEWYAKVQPGDLLLHLGDIVCFGDRSKHAGYLEGLPGRKLLIRGNHDDHKNDFYEQYGFTVWAEGTRRSG